MRKVLLVDDHELLAGTLAGALRSRGYEAVHRQPASAEAVVQATRELQPEVVLLDLDLGSRLGTSISLIEPLRETGARVVMLTATTDRRLLAECVEAGAHGLLTKNGPLDDVVEAIEDVATHGTLLSPSQRERMVGELRHWKEEQRARHAPFERLTPREQEVLAALTAGKTAQTIAGETFTSVRTVRGHIQSVLDKLGVSSQVTAIAKAREAEWPPEGETPQH